MSEESHEARLAQIISDLQDATNRGEVPNHEAIIESHPEFRSDLKRFFSFDDFVETVLLPTETPALPSPTIRTFDFGAFPIRRRLVDGPFGPVYLVGAQESERERELAVLPLNWSTELRERLNDVCRAASGVEVEGMPLPRHAESSGAVPFLVRDHLDGSSLESALRAHVGSRGAVSIEAAILGLELKTQGAVDRATRSRLSLAFLKNAKARRLLLQRFARWARILDRGHRAGFVHGFLSPEDFIVDADGREGVRNVGLGPPFLGLNVDEIPSSRRRWLAPEAVHPRLGPWGYEADLFAFALILVSTLTFDLPYWDSDGDEMLARIATEAFDEESLRARGVDGALATLLVSCLERDPLRRPVGLGVVAHRLDRCVSETRRRFIGAALGVAALIIAVVLLFVL